MVKSRRICMPPSNLPHQVAKETGVLKQLHPWPDKSLGSGWVVQSMPKPDAHSKSPQGLSNRLSARPST
jgi:hypothetical protein